MAVTAAAFVSCNAHATLVLDTSLQGGHGFNATGANLQGNDLGNKPNRVHFGQLGASANGTVDYFFVGGESSFTNTLRVGGYQHSTAGTNMAVSSPFQLIGDVDIGAGALLSFGFCTSGGSAMGGFGGCAHNNDGASLLAQFGQGPNEKGYRSIGFAPLASFDEASGEWTFGSGTSSDLWMIFWDDSGAHNDDDHDDYIAIARFTGSVVDSRNPLSDISGGDLPDGSANAVLSLAQVPEPATGLLLAGGVAALGWSRRRRVFAPRPLGREGISATLE
jgi:hypothetical protein